MTRLGPIVIAAACCGILAAPASAKWYGSTMRATPNADFGCETALINGPLGGVQRSPTNQASRRPAPTSTAATSSPTG